jgi:hypothetical protein
MLEAHPGPKTFLIPPHTAEAAGLSFVELGDYTHPSDAIYVFGNGAENLVRWVTSDDEVVSIRTPSRADLFAAVVVGVVLHDRAVKQ